jgi:hypothetical protein
MLNAGLKLGLSRSRVFELLADTAKTRDQFLVDQHDGFPKGVADWRRRSTPDRLRNRTILRAPKPTIAQRASFGMPG